jgi:hypothetical protein
MQEPVITAEAYREYMARWRRVNEFELAEQRRRTPEERLRDFFALQALAKAMNWETTTAAEVEQVRATWRKLKEAYCGKSAR